MRDDLFDKLLQQNADRHEAPVPADAWKNIEEKKKKRRYIGWWWGAGLLLAGLGTFGLYKMNHTKDKVSAIASIEKKDTALSTLNNGTDKQIKNLHQQATGETISSVMDSTGGSFSTKTNKENTENATGISPSNNSLVKNKTTGIFHNDIPTQQQQGNNSGEKIKLKQRLNMSVTTGNSLSENHSPANENAYTKNNQHSKKPGRTKMLIKNGVTSEDIIDNNTSIDTLDPTVVIAQKTNDLSGNNNEVITQPIAPLQQTDSVAGSTIAKTPAPAVTDTLKKETSVVKNKKEPGKIKGQLFFDLSVTAFTALQNNDPLLSISRTTIDGMHKSEFTATDIRTTMDASFAYTFMLRKNISKKLAVGTGLEYSFIKETVRLSGRETNTYYNIVKRLNTNNGSPFLFDDTVATSSSGRRIIHATNSYELISIPLHVQYQWLKKNRWELSVNGGTFLNVSTRYNNSITGILHPVYTNGKISGANSTQFTADLFAGIRFSRRFGKRYEAFAAPNIRYSLVKYDMNTIINSKYIHRAGISLGLTVPLGK